MIEVEYTGANSLVCILGVDDFTQAEYVNNASVSVLWSGPNVMYNLETDVDPVTGILVHYLINVCVYLSILNSDTV